jgi:hypothetical protein
MKWLLSILIVLCAGVVCLAQSPTDCPPNLVCITPEAARKALEDSDVRKALEAENATLKQSLADQRNLTADVKIELAKTVGEKTRLEIEVPRLSGLLEVCMKKRGIKVGLLNF